MRGSWEGRCDAAPCRSLPMEPMPVGEALQPSMPSGVGHRVRLQLVAHHSVSEGPVRVWRPLARSLPLAPHGSRRGKEAPSGLRRPVSQKI